MRDWGFTIDDPDEVQLARWSTQQDPGVRAEELHGLLEDDSVDVLFGKPVDVVVVDFGEDDPRKHAFSERTVILSAFAGAADEHDGLAEAAFLKPARLVGGADER